MSGTPTPQRPSDESEEPLHWLERLARDPSALDALDEEARRRVHEATNRIAFPTREERKAMQRQRRRGKRRETRERDEAALAGTSNRAIKRSLRFPKAPPELVLSERDRELLERQAPDVGPAPSGASELAEERACYVCKEPYTELHQHYDSMCPACAELNWEKRHQTADLRGRVAVVTGARVKIGYEAALMLLRAGATVVATTRFPRDSARRFAKEEDFDSFGDRLRIHGLDLRHTPSVERLATHLEEALPRLDFLIHNACQTVRRPPAYYDHLVRAERELALNGRENALLHDFETLREEVAGRGAVALKGSHPALTDAPGLAQLDLLGEADLAHLFPTGMLDGEGQQLDLRAGNSWRMQLVDVPTVELFEVLLVNAIAPFVLTKRLKSLMLRVPTEDKHVVNVSAMEGQFARSLKTTRHPHTNMAKAALNMMTRTSAADFVRDGIHMNSVDTGWVTDEDPFEKTVEKQTGHRFVPPLDAVDGAARVLDPVFTGFLTGVHCWGQFLKDYRPSPW